MQSFHFSELKFALNKSLVASDSPTRLYSPRVILFQLRKSPLSLHVQIYTPSAILILLFLYVNLTMTMNPLSSKVHFLAQTRQTKRRTKRTGRTENQHERATSFAHAQTFFSPVAPTGNEVEWTME